MIVMSCAQGFRVSSLKLVLTGLLMVAASIPGRSVIRNATPIRRAHPHFVENICTLGARIAGYDDIEPIGVTDIPSSPDPAPQPGRPEQQLAVLAVRLEMAAVYLRLVAGSR